MHQYESVGVQREDIYFGRTHKEYLQNAFRDNLNKYLSLSAKQKKPIASVDAVLIHKKKLSIDTNKAQGMIKNLKITSSNQIKYIFVINYLYKNDFSDYFLSSFLHTSKKQIQYKKYSKGLWIFAEGTLGWKLVLKKYNKRIKSINKINKKKMNEQFHKKGIVLIHQDPALMDHFNHFIMKLNPKDITSDSRLHSLVENYRIVLEN